MDRDQGVAGAAVRLFVAGMDGVVVVLALDERDDDSPTESNTEHPA